MTIYKHRDKWHFAEFQPSDDYIPLYECKALSNEEILATVNKSKYNYLPDHDILGLTEILRKLIYGL